VESRIAIAFVLLAGAIVGCSSEVAVEPSVEPTVRLPARVEPEAVEERPASLSPTGLPPVDATPVPSLVQVDSPSTETPDPIDVPQLGSGPLHLQAEIPIVRSDFGVRFVFSPTDDILLHSGSGL
jgi:hypothetical protein